MASTEELSDLFFASLENKLRSGLDPLAAVERAVAVCQSAYELEPSPDAASSPEVSISCIYFKHSGKFYADGTLVAPREVFAGCHYPSEFGKRLKELKQLPGLQSGEWDGPFTITVTDLYTELVPGDPDPRIAQLEQEVRSLRVIHRP